MFVLANDEQRLKLSKDGVGFRASLWAITGENSVDMGENNNGHITFSPLFVSSFKDDAVKEFKERWKKGENVGIVELKFDFTMSSVRPVEWPEIGKVERVLLHQKRKGPVMNNEDEWHLVTDLESNDRYVEHSWDHVDVAGSGEAFSGKIRYSVEEFLKQPQQSAAHRALEETISKQS